MAKIVISQPKTRKSFQIEKDLSGFLGKKIGEQFDGSFLGLNGFTLEVTGGSDKDGFPMRADLAGTVRKKVLLASGPGYRTARKGVRKRKYVRGNTVSEETAQVNCKIVSGEGNVAEFLGIKPKEAAQEEKKEEKK